jgi:glycosyltransferase involved in cell wall biosynthesis
MNVLFLTLVDFKSISDRNLYSDLLRELVKNGHHVTVVSPFERDGVQRTRVEKDELGSVIKVEIDHYQKSNVIQKGLSIITVSSKINRALKQYLGDQPVDLVLYSTPPITLVNTVKYLKKKTKAHTYLLLKDIFPQNAVDLKMMSSTGLMHRYFRYLESQLYNLSDFIGCMSEANRTYVLEHNPEIPSHRVEVCPNSIEPSLYPRVYLSRSDFDLPEDKTIFLYGGNLGKPQGIDFLIKTFNVVMQKDWAYFLIVGSGTEAHRIVEFIDRAKPSNIRYQPTMITHDYEQLTRCCDVGLIYLDSRFTIPNFPSRLLSYLDASLPVFAVTDHSTDLGSIVESNGFGVWSPSDDVEGFEAKLDRFHDEEVRKAMGKKGNQFLLQEYTVEKSYQTILSHWEGKTNV